MAIYWAGGEMYVHCREVVHSSKCPLSEVPLLLASKCRTTNTVPCAKYPTEGSPYFRGVLRKRFHCIPSFICFPLTFQVWWDYIRPAPLNYRGYKFTEKRYIAAHECLVAMVVPTDKSVVTKALHVRAAIFPATLPGISDSKAATANSHQIHYYQEHTGVKRRNHWTMIFSVQYTVQRCLWCNCPKWWIHWKIWRKRIFVQRRVSKGHFSSLDADRHSVWRFPSHFPLFLFVYLLFISVHHLFTGTLQQWTVSVNMKYWIQWNLPIVGMLETSVLSISWQCSDVEMYGNMAIYWAGGEMYVHCKGGCPLFEVSIIGGSLVISKQVYNNQYLVQNTLRRMGAA